MYRSNRLLIIFFLLFSIRYSSAQKATYIANEGILIEHLGTKILIDALFENKNPRFMAAEQGVVLKLVAGRPPYNVNLALVTHAHVDHFSVDLSVAFLKSNEKAEMILPRSGLDSLKKDPSASGVLSKVNAPPYNRSWYTYNNGAINVKAAYVKHAGKKNAKVQSLVYLISIGNKKILHLGDLDQDLSRFDYLNMDRKQIDIVFVPFWYLTNFYGVEIIKKYFNAKKIVGIHFPLTAGSKSLAKIKQQAPNAVVFTKEGQVVKF